MIEFATRRRYGAWLTAFAALCLPIAVAADPLTQPIALGNVHPVGLLHLSQHPQDSGVLAAGDLHASALGSISNTVNREKGIFLIDAETRVLDLALALGIGDELQLGARLPLYYRGSGFTDQPIDEWHQTFGLPRGPRRRIPKDDYSFSGLNEDGTRFDLASSGTGLGNLELNAKYRILDSGEGRGLAIAPALSLPTSRSEFGAEQIDFGLSVFYELNLSAISIFTGASYFHYLDESVGTLHTASNVLQAFIGAGAAVSENWSLYLGLEAATAQIQDVVKYPEYQVYLDFGARIRVADRTAVVIGLRENPGPSEGTTDISFVLGLDSVFASRAP